MARSDSELVVAAQSGDTSAVDELLARHERQVYRFGLRMCGNEADARDVLQETLVAALKGLPGFRGEADLSTWLYRIARSYCTKTRRRHAGEPQAFVELDKPEARAVVDEARPPEEVAHARQIGRVLQTAIASLPEHYRETIVLKDVEGLAAEEAARVLELDVAAFKSRLHRARTELRGRLTTLLDRAPAGAACPELARELSDYVGDDIDQTTCARIEEHLERCPRCTSACDSLKRTVSLCRQVPGDVVPEEVRRAVRHALQQAGASQRT